MSMQRELFGQAVRVGVGVPAVGCKRLVVVDVVQVLIRLLLGVLRDCQLLV